MANDFSEQDLRGANFYHAHLDAANFRGANLKAVPDLSAIRTDDGLIRADFTEATCRAADFSDADLSGAICIVKRTPISATLAPEAGHLLLRQGGQQYEVQSIPAYAACGFCPTVAVSSARVPTTGWWLSCRSDPEAQC